MIVFVLVLLLTILPPYSCGFSWAKLRSPARPHIGTQFDDVLGTDEIAMILRNAESLESYTRERDCFRHAAGRIQMRCGQLDMDEGERIKAAISMTLCELATAKHHAPPLECASFAPDADTPDTLSSTESLGCCVDALSRSAQYWSSYSGYLREVPQLCYAFRRWNDIDTARDIYKNATIEKMALLRYLNDREIRLHEGSQLSRRILSDMERILDDLRLSIMSSELASDKMMNGMQAGLQETVVVLRDALYEVLQHSEDTQTRAALQVRSAIDSVTDRHAESLDGLVLAFEQSLRSNVEQLFFHMEEQHQNVFNVADTFRLRSAELSTNLEVMQESVIGLLLVTSQAVAELEMHVEQAHSANHAQLAATDSAVRLTEALTELTDKTHAEIEKINGTALAVKQGLLSGSFERETFGWYWSTWGKAGVVYLLEIILRVNPVYLEYLTGLPTVRMLALCFRLIWHLLQVSFSSLMSMAVLLISLKRWLPTLRNVNEEVCNNLAEFTGVLPKQQACRSPVGVAQWSSSTPLRYGYDSYPVAISRRQRPRVSRVPDRLCNPHLDTPL
ncbi:Nuclear fusion protein [Sparassis crispa]|uniref:Nuclear fusion protein n=1 Tax=Sparassis crispa TaxID=139825 RepID=A0A401GZE2_9APHY|nr:Nuclear fusion protein [Sparassis crispa]GBE87534.1 Nuclear fusion protein [Sparassis crispa]